VLYTALAALVWRLRVLALPLLAVQASLLLSPRIWFGLCMPCSKILRVRRGSTTSTRVTPTCPATLLPFKWLGAFAGLSLSACYLSKHNSFYDQGLNPDTEREDRWAQYKMFSWIRKNIQRDTTAGIVIAGDAVNLASARLALPETSIVAHPHYEHPLARKRFREAKEYFYACGSAKDAHKYAIKLGVTHLLLDVQRLAPNQAVSLSRFYKKRRQCHNDMGAALMGMQRTVFQIILGDDGLFEPLHVVGPYTLVRVVPASLEATPAAGKLHAVAAPGDPRSWAPLLDRCPQYSSKRSCAENLGLLIRTLADPMRQHGWVRAFSQEALRRYPREVKLQALLGRTFDYDLSDFNTAVSHYRQATQLQPRAAEHWAALGSILAQVWGRSAEDELRSIMEQQASLLLGSTPGPGPRDLGAQRLCQAAAWSRSLRLGSRWEETFWREARSRSRFGCVFEQWELMEGAPRAWKAIVDDFLRFAD